MQGNAMRTQWIFKLIFYSRQLFIYQCIFLSLHYPNILLINFIERSNHIQLIFMFFNWRISNISSFKLKNKNISSCRSLSDLFRPKQLTYFKFFRKYFHLTKYHDWVENLQFQSISPFWNILSPPSFSLYW